MPIPNSCQVLVVGGGPGGSYTASALAREGFDVVLFEATRFPRYHIGESMLPSLRQFLRYIDCEDKVVQHGFAVKPGAAVKFTQFKREGYTDFIENDPTNGAWNVVRSEFDDILLNHAAECGAKVFQEVKVTSLLEGPKDNSYSLVATAPKFRPKSAEYTTSSGEKGKIDFDYIVDASGRMGLISTKYLQNRHINESLKNIACWSYWTGGAVYMKGSSRENAPFFEALTDESGWAWYIPLHNGTVSVGVVMSMAESTKKKKTAAQAAADHALRDHYLAQLKLAPSIHEFLHDASLDEDAKGSIKSASDFSYSASCYAGDHFRMVGDAAAFIDPFFSSGVHLALTGAFSAAASIASSIRGEVNEETASSYHDKKVGTAYTRFLLVVLGVYKQIHALNSPILSDINEDNFDRAFDIIRPIIQGSADTARDKITESEISKTMDFCKHLFAPTDPKMYTSVGNRVNQDLLSVEGPILAPETVDAMFGEKDEEAVHVIKEVNARKAIHTMYRPASHFEQEVLCGLRVQFSGGRLGLVKA